MKKYQLVDVYGNDFHAGSKATNDCVDILSSMNFEICALRRTTNTYSLTDKIKRHIDYVKNFKEIYDNVEENSVMVLQNPFKYFQLSRYTTLKKLKNRKNVKFISIVHDVNLIRESWQDSKTQKEFKEMLAISDKFIVHNEKMKQWFIDYGIEESRLVELEIFDYLNSDSPDKKIEFSKRVQLAGNLWIYKSPYIYKLKEVTDVEFDLFGVEFESSIEQNNVVYHGAFPAEEVPMQLNKGFGLVWDGSSVDTCDGDTGKYLRYNNPHKLSLYLSSALPVIIWDQAAEADFVKKHNVGIVVSSLHELKEKFDNLSEEEYYQMVENARGIQEKLQSGYYLKKAINKAIESI